MLIVLEVARATEVIGMNQISNWIEADSALFVLLLLLFGVLSVAFASKSRNRIEEETMPVRIGNDQIIGFQDHQNDYFSTEWNDYGICCVVADGIGDDPKSCLASTLAVETVIGQFMKMNTSEDTDEFFDRALRQAHREVAQKTITGGASAATVIINAGYLDWASVGNVSLYLFRDSELRQLNKQHIYRHLLEKKVLSAEMSRDVALKSKWKQEVTNYLGYENFRKIEMPKEMLALEETDQIVLCTQGLFKQLSTIEIETILSQQITPQEKAEACMKLLERKQFKNQDNATIVILDKWQMEKVWDDWRE